MDKTVSKKRRPLDSAVNRFSNQQSAVSYQAKAEASVTKKIKLVLLMFLAFMLLQVSLCAAAGTLDWAMRAGGSSGADVGKSVAVLPDNTAIVTGYFVGTATFGPGEVNETIFTGGGMFVAKYNTNGSLAWAKQVSGAWGYSVAALPDGTSFVTGPFVGTVTFGLNESNQTTLTATTSYTNIYVAKYNANGTLAWATRAGSTGVDDARSIAALADGSCIVTGLYSDTATFDQTVLAHTGVGYNMFVAKYNPSGTLAWAKGIPGSGTHDSLGYGIGTLADGSSIVTGTFSGTAIFGQSEVNQTTLLANGSDHDMFVARYNANGTLAWARSAGSSGYYDEGRSVAVLADGSALIAGYFYSSATFGQGNQTTLTSAGGGDVFVAKYDPAGTLVWARQAGGTGSADQAHGISALADGSFFISGYFNGTAIFGPGETNQTSLTAVGSVDIDLFVAKYHANGSLAWARSAGGSTKDLASDIAALTDGSAIVTGGYSTTAVFGQGDPNQTSLFSAGTCSGYGCNYDVFVAKYSDNTCSCLYPPSGLVGWWPLDDSSYAPSLVGSHTGILGGTPAPSSIAGMVGNALTFNGNNWVSVPDHNSLDIGTSDFSVDAWIYRSNVSGVRSIIDKRTGGYVRGYHVYIWPGGLLGVQMGDGSTNNPVNHISSLSVPVNGWHFVGVSVNRVNQTIEFRVDGATQTMSGIGAYSSLANTANLLIGGHSLSPFGHFVGEIDEVEIFNRALTSAEMLDIYNAGSDGKCKQRVSLPQTRQMSCYDINGTVTSCASTTQSQDGKIQAGVVWPSQRFAGSGSVVLDNLTGLEWAQDAGTPTFTGNFSTCTGGAMNWQAALDYVACLNLNNYLGHNDWRLPNINELKSPVNVGQANTLGWLTAQGFTNLQSGNYWSSTSGASATSSYAWGLMFDNVIVDYDAKSFQYYVWPVRGGQFCSADPAYPANISQTGQTISYDANNSPQTDDGASQWGVPWPSPRFTDNSDNCTVTDDLTGLVWPTDASTPSCTFGGNTLGGQMSSWQDAFNYVQCLNSNHYCSQTDWRLPNINELHSLVDHSNYAPALPGVGWFSGPQFTGLHYDHYWSSTAKVGAGLNMTNPNDAWTVDFWGGGVYNNNPASRLPYVLPVRGGSLGTLCTPLNTGSGVAATPVPNLTFTFTGVNTSATLCAQVLSSPVQIPSSYISVNGISYSVICPPAGTYTVPIMACIDAALPPLPIYQISQNGGAPLLTSATPISSNPLLTSFCAQINSCSEFVIVEPIDTTPDQFTFTTETNAPLNAFVMSGLITISGINAPSPISISNGEYSVGGAFTASAGTVNNGDRIRVRLTTSDTYSTTTSVTLTIGGVSGTFSVTTAELIPTTPVQTPDHCASGSNPSAAGNITVNGLSTTNVIVGSTVTLTDSSSLDGSLYINWGDGTPMVSPMSSPSSVLGGANNHVYNYGGTFHITQTVKNACGYVAQHVYTVNVTGGATGKGTLLISASGSAHSNIGYKVMDGNTTVSTGTIAVGGSKSIILDAKTYTVKFTYQSKTPLTDPLTYHSCSTLPSGAVTSSNGSTVTVNNVTVPIGGTVSVSLNDCDN